MLVPFDWLKEYVDFDLSPDQLAERLTMAGLEVETIIQRGKDISSVVVGVIESVAPHPNADRLALCRVGVGDRTLQIVCGATNMRPGDKVPVALDGATLPGGVRIKAGRIREAISEGMLCSAKELGLGEDASGILILPAHLEAGTNLNPALGLDEPVLDVQVTPNRCDWASMIGIAREVAVLTGTKLKLPVACVTESQPDVSSLTSVHIDDPDMCPRYAARIIRGVRVGPSPEWMQDRLMKGGLRPINNVVDATNYVLLEQGQPLHAFDYDRLVDHRIVVRRARQDEHIVTLDMENRALFTDVLVIADAVKPVALAGIMGGKDTEVTTSTCNILIESAHFDPGTIRRGSKKMGLSTEASYRFERGTDPEAVLTAADRAVGLIQELGGGEVARGAVDICPRPVAPVELVLRPERVNLVLGTSLSEAEIARTLTQLEFGVTHSEDKLRVVVPSFRGDVRREVDLIEEVARVQGYDRIPLTWPRTALTVSTRNDEFSFTRTVVDTLASLGMTEIITLSFSCREEMASIGYADTAEQMITLMNPMSEKQSALRMSLIPGIMRTLERNVRRRRSDCALFEVGRTFAPPTAGQKPREVLMAAGAIVGDAMPRYWQGAGTKRDFYYLKGIVTAFLRKLRCPDITFHTGRHPSLSDKACAEISVGKTVCGFLGEIRETVRDRFGIGETVFLFELNLDVLRPMTGIPPVHKPLPRFPSSGRDVALVVAEHVQAEDLIGLIKSRGGELVHEVTLFDVYRGPQVPAGMKSLAFSIEYLAPDRTLTDQEVNTLHERITEALAVKFHARVREA